MKKYFKLNQTVYHPVYGEGVIKYIDSSLSVKFEETTVYFTLDGRIKHTERVVLSQNPISEIINKPLEDTYVPFTFEDRELLRGKWIKEKGNDIWETMVIFINRDKIGVDGGMYYSYKELLERFVFIDGKPCGKLG